MVDDELYVRAYNGTRSRWYQTATNQHAGRITAAGRSFDVTFDTAAADGGRDLADAIDAAYRAKYDPSPYVAQMIGAGSRQATIRIRAQREPLTDSPTYSRDRSLL